MVEIRFEWLKALDILITVIVTAFGLGIIANPSRSRLCSKCSHRVNHNVRNPYCFLVFWVPRVYSKEKKRRAQRHRSALPLLEAEAVDHSARVGVNDQHDFVPLVVVLCEPYRSVEQLHVPNVRLGVYRLDHVIFRVRLL